MITGCLLFAAEVVGFIESAMFYLTLWDTDTPSTPKVDNKDFQHVDIFVATIRTIQIRIKFIFTYVMMETASN